MVQPFFIFGLQYTMYNLSALLYPTSFMSDVTVYSSQGDGIASYSYLQLDLWYLLSFNKKEKEKETTFARI